MISGYWKDIATLGFLTHLLYATECKTSDLSFVGSSYRVVYG